MNSTEMYDIRVLLPLLVALLSAPAAALAGSFRPRWTAPVGISMATLAFFTTLWSWISGGGDFILNWAPSWDLRLSFRLDGLAAMYSLLATGIGAFVLLYSSGYLPLHLKHENRPESDAVRFYTFLLLFMGSMVGLVMAQDLILLFIFWDLTAIASYFLIGFDFYKAEARWSALMAFLVTGISSVLFLIGAFLLYGEHGTFELPILIQRAPPGLLLTVAGGLMALAALAKSAQVPFHFWLPRAMVAPTPVSAYLHSAAMVAAGVFLLGRLYPLLQKSQVILDGLLVFGMLSIVTGGILALASDTLKRVLAYSTISQYGYIVFMFGLGGSAGAAAASYYVLAHALIKSSLFLTAGAVTEATGEDRLSRLGGLWRELPWLAAGSGAAAAGLAALPFTTGFFKDELFFEAALERGSIFVFAAVFAAALTLTYIWRFWSSIFLGASRGEARRVSFKLVAPVVGLGFLVVVGGIYPQPLALLAEAAGSVTIGETASVDLSYHLDLRMENLLALAVYGVGLLLILARPVWRNLTLAVARVGEQFGPEKGYRVSLILLNRISTVLYQRELRSLANRIATVLIPTAILVVLALLSTPVENAYQVGVIRLQDLPLLTALGLTAVTALIVTIPRTHLTQVLVISAVDFSLAAVYAFFGAPDVALVAVLIGTVSTIFFISILSLIPQEVLEGGEKTQASRQGKSRDLGVGMISGIGTFLISWAVLSQPASKESVAVEYMRLAPSAHAGDVVTAILSDFRGLDTLGEITVLVIVVIGLASLLRKGDFR